MIEVLLMVMVMIILVMFRRSELIELAEAALEIILTIALNFLWRCCSCAAFLSGCSHAVAPAYEVRCNAYGKSTRRVGRVAAISSYD